MDYISQTNSAENNFVYAMILLLPVLHDNFSEVLTLLCPKQTSFKIGHCIAIEHCVRLPKTFVCNYLSTTSRISARSLGCNNAIIAVHRIMMFRAISAEICPSH